MMESPIGVVGTRSETTVREWEERDTLLYAVGVGAGAIDPVGFELAFTTENSKDVAQLVFPTFASLLGPNLKGVVDWSKVDRSKLVHGEQTVTLARPLPTAGSASLTTTLLGVLDKGSGCLVVVETVGEDVTSGEGLFRARAGLFIRGAGGFDGPKYLDGDDESALTSEAMPSRSPDHVVTYETRTDQALLYRLSGDRNPLHSDPTFAARAGFPKPILHGLCTYGFSGRVGSHTVPLGPCAVLFHARSLLQAGLSGRRAHHFDVGRIRASSRRVPIPHVHPERRRRLGRGRLSTSQPIIPVTLPALCPTPHGAKYSLPSGVSAPDRLGVRSALEVRSAYSSIDASQ